MPRKTVSMLVKRDLASDSDTTDLIATPAAELQRGGECSVQCIIDNGAGGAPTDTPIGTWECYASATGEAYSPVTTPLLTTALATIAPNGNVKISAWIILRGVPGKFVKFRYKKGTGGAGSSRVSLSVTVDDDD
jgi:hypothetical protein